MLSFKTFFSGVGGSQGPRLLLLLSLWLGLLGLALPRAQAQTTTDTTRTVAHPPVRFITPDPSAPKAAPPPGVAEPGRPSSGAASRQIAPTAIADTSRRVRDSLNVVMLKRRSQVETAVKYKAKDSIQFDIDSKTARLYNKSAVDYGAMSLNAALITVNYGANTVQAAGQRDTVKHKLVDTPVMKDEAGTYQAERIAYNFKTKKGKIGQVITKQGEGIVHAEVVKKMPNNDTYGLRGRYTTCDLADPHFYIEAKKMKVIPGQKVITGPFHMVIAGIPLPIGLPFGYFPTPHNGRGSGIIIPTFGQGAQRGFSLSNGGYYWAPNDYIGVRLTGDIYAGNADRFGGWALNADISYRKRYKYTGSFRLSFANQPVTPILNTTTALNSDNVYANSINTFWINWSHTPTPLPGGGVFSASVQAGSSSYNRVNTLNARQLLSAAFNSNISYSKQLRRLPINYSLQASQTQNVQTGEMTFTLPNLSVGVARQYPYQWFGISPRGRWYEQFAVSYSLVGQNRISNLVPVTTLASGLPLLGGNSTAYYLPVSLKSAGSLLRNAQNGLQHQFQITLPSAAVLGNHIQIQPSIQYGETWYAKSLSYSYEPLAKAIRVDTLGGFNRAYAVSGGATATTNFYGTVVFKGDHYVKAIRHKVTPSLSYSYSPDLSKNAAYLAYNPNSDFVNQVSDAYYGTSRNRNQILDPALFARYQGFAYGTPTTAAVNQIAFTIQNQIEMKVRNSQDTTGNQPTRKVSLADGLDVAVSYNFGTGRRDARGRPLDTLKLSPLTLNYRVQIAKKLNVNFTSTFIFYQRDSTGRLINRYLWEQNNSRRLARIASANLSLGYQFNPAARPKKASNVPRATAPTNDPVLGTPLPPSVYADYIDFDIPWEATVAYTATYTTAQYQLRPLLYNQLPFLSGNSVTASGSVKLTKELRLQSTLSFDLVNKTLPYPQVSFYRDLHCWQISGTWTPVGPYRGYFFTLAAKSSLLQDLKLNRNKTILNR
ncbi:LPS-assembly protein LptD [Hymenobacter sp. RP-2-7]|uniref:LPS-assembly protein LptD n=1 Tax=Hymenobacter polaris TaxID=2682546 RepID=A0A7Y0AB44_9BACT|nr:putative LPS assembly protein LptD [Hymenobacter polaris]NML64038.1 LPS-assembly protein LptD [Hymenobacter polaris]